MMAAYLRKKARMPYVPSDPAESLRIVRQSLLSTVGRLYNAEPPTPEKAIEIARIWEAYVYEPLQGQDTPPPVQFTANGTAVSTTSALVCAECGEPVAGVTFKKTPPWTAEHLAQQGLNKYGQVLCKTHYFGRAKV